MSMHEPSSTEREPKSVRVGPRGTIRVVLSPSLMAVGAALDGDTVPQLHATFVDFEDTEANRALGELAAPRTEPVPPMPAQTAPGLDFRPGQVFRGYVVAGKFAEGGVGLLYEATHQTSMKRCLIKVLRPAYRGPAHRTMQLKLLAEGKFLMANRRNESLCPCHDVGEDEAVGAYLIMDKLEGMTLAEHITKQRAGGKTFDPMMVVRLGAALCLALQAAHEAGAIHRDLKPANIFILSARAGLALAVILDWGAAKSTHSPDTRHEPVFGTLAYMPEELLSRGPISGATDEYALALILVELMWRHVFLSDHTLTDAQLVAKIRFSSPDAPPASFVPRRLWAVLQKSLSKNPDERHGSCELLRQALVEWMNNPDALEKKDVRASMPVGPTIPMSGKARNHKRTPAAPPTDIPDPSPRLRMDELSERASLIVRNGIHAGARFVLTSGRTLIGRHPGMCHVVLTDERITQKHAALECLIATPTKPMYSLTDLESLNGVSVGGVRLSDGSDDSAPEAVTVGVGDPFVLGDIELVIAPAGRLGIDGAWETFAQVTAARQAAERTAKKAAADKKAGAAQSAAVATPKPVAIARPALRVPLGTQFRAPTLLVKHGARTDRFHLEKLSTLGSSKERANIVIEDNFVSQAHLRFSHVSGRFGGELTFLVEDLASLNGLHRSEAGRMQQVKCVAVQPGMDLFIGNEESIRLTLLAPGEFDAGSGEFISCDEAGLPIRELRAQKATKSRIRWGRGLVVFGVFVLMVLAGVAGLLLARLQ